MRRDGKSFLLAHKIKRVVNTYFTVKMTFVLLRCHFKARLSETMWNGMQTTFYALRSQFSIQCLTLGLETAINKQHKISSGVQFGKPKYPTWQTTASSVVNHSIQCGKPQPANFLLFLTAFLGSGKWRQGVA